MIVQEALNLLYKYGLQLDRSLTIALKSLMQTEELVRTLAPELSFLNASRGRSPGSDHWIKFRVMQSTKGLRSRASALQKTWLSTGPSGSVQLAGGQSSWRAAALSMKLDTRELNKNIEQVNKSLNRSVRSVIVGLADRRNAAWLSYRQPGTPGESALPGFSTLRCVYHRFHSSQLYSPLGYVIYSLWITWRRKEE